MNCDGDCECFANDESSRKCRRSFTMVCISQRAKRVDVSFVILDLHTPENLFIDHVLFTTTRTGLVKVLLHPHLHPIASFNSRSFAIALETLALQERTVDGLEI